MGRFSGHTPATWLSKSARVTSGILFVCVGPYLQIERLAHGQETASGPGDVHLLSGLAVVGWLAVAAITLTAPGQRRERYASRLFTAALGLAVLYGTQMVWPNPNIEGLLTAAVPLLIVWPFVSTSIPRQFTIFFVAGALYALILICAAIMRLASKSSTIGLDIETQVIWAVLTIAAVLYGQLLLGLQRLLLLRSALVALAIAAILGTSVVIPASTIAVLLSIVLVLAQFLVSVPPGEREAAVPHYAHVARQHVPPSVSRPDYLYERRQLLSMRLASIVAHDATPDVEKLDAMLATATALIPADAAYILQLREHPVTCVEPLACAGTERAGGSTYPGFLCKADAPALFHALRSDRTLIFSQQEWGQSPNLDALFRTLGSAEPGPTIIQPITHKAKAYGLVLVCNYRSKRFLTEEQSSLVQVLSARLASVMARQDQIYGIALCPAEHTEQPNSGGTNPAAVAGSFC